MRPLLFVVVPGLLGLAVACGGDDKPAPTPRDAVLEAWKADKLIPSAMTPATVAFAKDCLAGSIEGSDERSEGSAGAGSPGGAAGKAPRGIELLLCSFPTPAEAKAAEGPGLAWVGAATGASQARGAVLIVIADRQKADPSGRTINRLLKLAPN